MHPRRRDAPAARRRGAPVAAHPSRHPLRLGVALRDFALEQAELDGVTREVVAMTRCSHYARRNAADGADAAAYAAYVARADDPGLRFHTSAGAAVVGAVDGYRPEDGDNCGAAVLVRYTVGASEVAAAAKPAPAAPRVSEASFEAALTRAVGAGKWITDRGVRANGPGRRGGRRSWRRRRRRGWCGRPRRWSRWWGNHPPWRRPAG